MKTTRLKKLSLIEFLEIIKDLDFNDTQIEILEYMDYGQYTSAPVKEITVVDGPYPVIQLSR